MAEVKEWEGLRIVSLANVPKAMPWGVTDREGVLLGQFGLHSDALLFRRGKCLEMALQKTMD